MEKSLRANFILHIITIKYIKLVEEKIEFSSMLQRQRLISSKLFGDVSLATKIKQQQKVARKFSGGGKKMASCCPGVGFATPCHPMATGLHASHSEKYKPYIIADV